MYHVTMTHAVTEAGKLVALRGAARAEAEAQTAPKAVEAADYLMASFLALNPTRGACATIVAPNGNRYDLCSVEGIADVPDTLSWRAMVLAGQNARSLLGGRRRAA